MIIHRLAKEGVAHPPKWLADNTAYLTIMGSQAYAVSGDNSDQDIYGFCLPPKDMIFPWMSGHIPGFGPDPQLFNVWDQHHIRSDGKEYDFAVYSIVRYFSLAMDANPNMVDSLFTAARCVKHCTEIGTMVRDRRRIFLSKKVWHKFKGYAFQQLHKMDLKKDSQPEVTAVREYASKQGIDLQAEWPTDDVRFSILAEPVIAKGRRYVGMAQHGFDVKFAYHVVRLMCEVQQILEEGDLDLERNKEVLKSIRRGEWTEERIKTYFQSREQGLEDAYAKSTIPYEPQVEIIRELLMNCLEHHYGSISQQVMRETAASAIITEMQAVIDRYK